MISALLVILIQTPQTFESTMQIGRVQWPPEINSAVLPYLDCTQRAFDKAQADIEKRNGSRGLDLAGMKEADSAALAECADKRVTARKEALRLVNRMSDMSQEHRVQVVDAALASVDNARGPFIAMLSVSPTMPTDVAIRRPNAPSEKAIRKPKGVLVPNAMAPIFDRYVACFEENIDIASVQNQAGLQRAVGNAIQACKASRATLIAESETALMADPTYPDATSRSRVVADAFDTEDAIRRAMGEGRILYEDETN
ncbi:MAG: hypothetical protein JHD35_09015 [Sphingopyxis sp.]|nr:hypothetical protein [Sphingopyxis sp.]